MMNISETIAESHAAISESYRAQISALAEANGLRRECELWQQLAGSLAAENRVLRAELDALKADFMPTNLKIYAPNPAEFPGPVGFMPGEE